jgi:hypothetical protein
MISFLIETAALRIFYGRERRRLIAIEKILVEKVGAAGNVCILIALQLCTA